MKQVVEAIAGDELFRNAWARREAVVLRGLPSPALTWAALAAPLVLASRSLPPHVEGWRVEAWTGPPLAALEDGGTLVVNGAAETLPPAADLALAAIDAFGLPSSVNLYATASGNDAAPPHSDCQDIVAIQCAGEQRWRVWTSRRDDVGKDAPWTPPRPADLEVDLGVGDALFVPLGWPHATDTRRSREDSLHATLGLDLVAFGLPEDADLLVPEASEDDLEWHSILEAQRRLYADIDQSVVGVPTAAARDWARRYRAFSRDLGCEGCGVEAYIEGKLRRRGYPTL